MNSWRKLISDRSLPCQSFKKFNAAVNVADELSFTSAPVWTVLEALFACCPTPSPTLTRFWGYDQTKCPNIHFWNHFNSAEWFSNLGQNEVKKRRRHPRQLSVEFNLHCVSKEVPTFKLSVTLSNVNRFPKFLPCWIAYAICYKTHMTLPISP